MDKIRLWLALFTIFSFWSSSLNGEENDTEVLLVAQESSPNNIDPGSVEPNEGVFGVAWNIYDRLVTFGTKILPEGVLGDNYLHIIPQLAKSWEYDQDGTSLIFHLHEDATFHDGSPVTAHDVKWSLDRSLALVQHSAIAMKSGDLNDPDQFVVIDNHTIEIKLSHKNKISLPTLEGPDVSIINSKLAKQHATENDPWAVQWLKTHSAGGGPFKLESFIPGVQIVYARFDNWKSGPLPKLKKVVVNIVQSPQIRKKMLEQKVIDVCFELPLKESEELRATGKFQVFEVPMDSSMRFLDMNVKQIPFRDVRVRKAIAYAIPYDEIFKKVYKRGRKLYGAPKLSDSIQWPQASTYYTNLEKAKELLVEANYPNGFKTDLYIDMGSLNAVEPIAELIKENLKKIGIEITIHKIKAGEWGTEIGKKEMPMVINSFGSWVQYPDYFFFWNYHGQNMVYNTMSYQDPEMDKLIENAMETNDKAAYEKNIKEMIAKALEEVPRIPLIPIFQNVAMQPNVHGFVFWSFRQIAFASIYKTAVNSNEKPLPLSEG